MAFKNYLEDENDKPYFTTNSLAYYYDKMEGFAKAVDGSAKALNLTKEEVEKRLTLYIEQNKNELDQRLADWDGKLETFDSSVETLLSEWVDDGTLNTIIDSTLIDQKIAPLAGQLAEAEERQSLLKTSSKQDKKLYVTLMDDDGRVEVFTKLKPILDEYGLKMSFAINTGLVGTPNFMTWAQIKQLQTEGHEILNHTTGLGGVQISSKTLAQLEADFKAEKAAFQANGLPNYEYMVYSGVMPWQDVETRNKISKFYKCSFANTDAPVNYLPFDNYAIHRASSTYNPIQSIDAYIKMGSGYLVLFDHANLYDTAKLTAFRATLDYLIQKGFTFVSAKQMVDNFKTVLNLGNAGEDKFLLDQNGNVNFTINGTNAFDLNNVFFESAGFNSKPITDYKSNAVTNEKVGGTYAQYGLPQSGTVKTFRFDDDRFSYQEYARLNENEVWRRTWDDTKKEWRQWSPLIGVAVSNSLKPFYIKRGISLYNYSINKPLWARNDGYGVEFTNAPRDTAYNVGEYVNVTTTTGGANNRLHICIVAGTTSDVKPEYSQTLGGVTVDGTAQFKMIGDKVTFVDATGTIVTW